VLGNGTDLEIFMEELEIATSKYAVEERGSLQFKRPIARFSGLSGSIYKS